MIMMNPNSATPEFFNLSGALLNRPLSADMGRAVIEHLTAFGPLPKSGYLAGQAVASALFALYGVDESVKGPVNDLDIFYTDNHPDAELNANFEHGTDKEVFQITINSYGRNQLIDKSGRAIEMVYRKGDMNYIKMHGKTEMIDVIKTFDFNVVSVGVDLAKKDLQWTPSFETFILDRKAKAASARSFRSYARALKKRAEMPWIDWDMNAIAACTFEADLTTARYGVKPIVHATIQAILDKYDPQGHYPRPDAYDYNKSLNGVYPTILSLPGTVNPLGLPSLEKVIAFAGACRQGRTSDIDKMLKAGFPASLPLNESNEMLCRGIDIAQKNGHFEAFNHLCHHGRPSAAMLEVENMLVDMGAKKSASVYSSNGPLHEAALKGDVEFIRGVDLSVNNIDARAKDGRTPLALAAMFSNAETCHALIDRGASVKGCAIKDNDGGEARVSHTPFLDAIEKGIPECAKALIDRGADPHEVIHDGSGAFHVLLDQQRRNLTPNSAGLSVINDMVGLLLDAGVDINRVNGNGNTPLIECSKKMAFKVIWPLIMNGADMRNGPEGDPLDVAIKLERTGVCRHLIAAGVVPNEHQKSVANKEMLETLSSSQAEALVLTVNDEEMMELLNGRGHMANHLEKSGFNFESEMTSQASQILPKLEESFMKNKERLLRSWITRREALAAISEVARTSNALAL